MGKELRYINLQELPIGYYIKIWMWLSENNIGDMKEQVKVTGGEVDRVVMSEEEAILFVLRWSSELHGTN